MNLSAEPIDPVESALTGTPYEGYVYSYPHKTAYRTLDPVKTLSDLWRDEQTDHCFLYVHIPFCEFRCGFCNLFTRAVPPAELPARYLNQLRNEARVVKDSLGDAAFTELAIGGGTPTYLDERELDSLWQIVGEMGVTPSDLHVGMECSPGTVDAAKLRSLRSVGVDRISIGVQSFDPKEAAQIGRPQQPDQVAKALDAIADENFSTLNIDLIYGGENQTPASFIASIEQAMRWEPQEIFLYPLYVRPLTGLGKRKRDWDDHRLACYRAGRDCLRTLGYEQVSMRMFRRTDAPRQKDSAYACQVDGMVGLGCGARSYTRSLHYSTDFAVGRQAVHAILDDYIGRDPNDFAAARHGYWLDDDDQQRRFLIMSLLQSDGLDTGAFESRFGHSVTETFPELGSMLQRGLLCIDGSHWRLTDSGMERSDTIGPALYSGRVKSLMEQHECR